MNKAQKDAIKHFEVWRIIRTELKKNSKQSLSDIFEKYKLKASSRPVIMNMRLIENTNPNIIKYPNWIIKKDIKTLESFTDLYSEMLDLQKNMIYVYDKDNILIFKSKNKSELSRRFDITSKVIYARIRNGKPHKGRYYSYDPNFKIVITLEQVKQEIIKKEKNKKAIQKEKKMKGENNIDSFEDQNAQRQKAIQALEKAQKLNKPVVRLGKIGKDTIKYKLKNNK